MEIKGKGKTKGISLSEAEAESKGLVWIAAVLDMAIYRFLRI